MAGGNNLAITGAGVADNGTLTINSNDSSSSTLSFTSGAVTGTGTIALNAFTTGAVLAGSISQSTTSTISGFGQITAALTNNGTVDADVSGQLLYVLNNAGNSSLMEATGNGVLYVNPVTITQAPTGQITAANSAVDLNGCTITGGTLTSSGTDGIFNVISSPTVTLTNVINNSNINIYGGSSVNDTTGLYNTGTITVNANDSGSSTITISGSLAGTGNLVLGAAGTGAVLAGALSQGSSHTISGFGTISAAFTNYGTVNADVSGQTLYLEQAVNGSGTLAVAAGAKLAMAAGIGLNTEDALVIASTGRLDLANNHLEIYYGSGPDPISSIAAWIASGYAGGAWDGPGIMSTVAQSNSGSYGIGYADSADPGNPANLPSGTIEIKYTLLGDANLDGKVNGTDFNILAANFNTGGDSWDQGDFTYDGKVNGSDFNLLAANFNQGATQPALGVADESALSSFATANGISLTSAPEPASAAMLVMAGLGILRRRRRSTRQ